MSDANPDGRIMVTIGRERYPTRVRVPRVQGGTHELAADEPASVGGTDTGPTPYDLLLASIGACKAITARMYADRKGWPLESVEVRLRHDRRHPEDCENCEDKPAAKVDHADVELRFLGELSDEQLARLAEIADKCPVHKTVTAGMRIVSTLAGSAG